MRLLAPLLVAAFALSACGGGNDAAAPETTASDGARELSNVLELRAAFEADRGKTRLLVLLSPT